MITITIGGSPLCDMGRGPWGRRYQGGYTFPRGASEEVWGGIFCENCVDSILIVQHSKINETLQTTFACCRCQYNMLHEYGEK